MPVKNEIASMPTELTYQCRRCGERWYEYELLPDGKGYLCGDVTCGGEAVAIVNDLFNVDDETGGPDANE
jgi:hypothetical protein